MDKMMVAQFVMMKFIFLLALVGVIFDFFLSAAVVALYYSFIKRWRVYSRVTRQLRKAMKKHM
ncbi:hypothetical protein [Bartonella taylorii]|uniref:Uncharacterized protein n=1 Tax=Bartonella taylorii TaxID=33046 RepID=A0A9Q8YWA9_BARTA|nr:hypothetical protein [Bartonella taylorii]USP02264.1 hypothetical protein LAJ60_05130 [Bartonella taylorii]